ncbi:hypothetical protein, partial [Mycobacterium sp. E3198]|uniref:hypothetical protein n=1 Tax=Mycobacterium sp. E3198 TaxID=1834143 RepID=UPI003510289A
MFGNGGTGGSGAPGAAGGHGGASGLLLGSGGASAVAAQLTPMAQALQILPGFAQ